MQHTMVFLRGTRQTCYERMGVLLVQVDEPMCYTADLAVQPMCVCVQAHVCEDDCCNSPNMGCCADMQCRMHTRIPAMLMVVMG